MPAATTDARFKDQTLYVFRPRETQLIKAWPDLTAVRKHDRGQFWRPFEPDYPLIRPYRPPRKPKRGKNSAQLTLALDEPEQPATVQRLPPSPAERRRRAFDRFRFSCPKPVARRVEPFRSDHLPLLRLLYRRADLGDLFDMNPALGFCLAVADRIGSRFVADTDAAARVATLKQTEIMAQLGFPDSRRAARIMAKVRPASMSREAAVALRRSLGEESALRLFGHLPALNSGVLALVNDAALRPLVTPRLLEEVQAEPRETYFPFTAQQLVDCLEMAQALNLDLSRRRFSDRARIATLHEELAVDFLRLQRHRETGRDRFPSPPLPGNSDIVPLRSPEALIMEGHTQHNCVGTYVDKVAKGGIYIYRVLAPERATLSIVRLPGRPWQIGELLLAHNRAVSPETRAAVEHWLAEHSI
jgi:hypothetical protein